MVITTGESAVSVMADNRDCWFFLSRDTDFLSIAARRLHDRDKSAWWLVVFLLLPAALEWLEGLSLPVLFVRPWSDILVIPLGLRWIILLWGAVEIQFLKGTEGVNRFGNDPLSDNGSALASSF